MGEGRLVERCGRGASIGCGAWGVTLLVVWVLVLLA